MPVIGFLSVASPGTFAVFLTAFHQGLSEAGYIEGQNVAIEYRWAEGRYDRLPGLAAELVGRQVDVILVSAGSLGALAAKGATSTIPIVFTNVGDPVGVGLVASVSRPGGNATGMNFFSSELMPKRLELLSDLVPQVSVIAMLVNPDNPAAQPTIGEVQAAARTKGAQIEISNGSTETEIDNAFAVLAQHGAGALIVLPDAFFDRRRDQIVRLAARHAIPAIYQWREYVAAGGLISYGPDPTAAFHQA